MLANIAVTSVFLRDGLGQRIDEIPLGEQVAVQVNFTTTDAPAGQGYQISYNLDGEILTQNVTLGAGQSNGSFFTWRSGWYAEPGVHNVEVFVDSLDDIAEDTEFDNTGLLTFTPVTATPPVKFLWPTEGQLFSDSYIANYIDLDPSPNDNDPLTVDVRDFADNELTFNFHNGQDISIGTFQRMDSDFEIYAAASGTVSSTHDGEFDRHSSVPSPAPIANHVVVDHGSGWETRYFGLRRDSIPVVVGQQVQAGDLIGLIGSSGVSTRPDVHFEVRHNNRPVETLFDPATHYFNPPRYSLDEATLIDSGITNHYPASHRVERPSDVKVFSQAANQQFRAWFRLSGVNLDDKIEFFAFRPNGSLFSQGEVTALRNFSSGQWSFNRTLPTVPETGTWRVDYRVNGASVGEDFFQVTPDGEPEIRVDDENGVIILDERYTPIDFGVASRSTAAPARTFAVANHGSDVLTFTGLTLPGGFVMLEGLNPSLAPGEADTFSVGMTTLNANYFAGQIRILSNDADEAEYNFSVEGLVTDASLENLTLGIGLREIDEAGQTVARLQRTGDTSQELTVDLVSSDASEAAVPATVTIPAGQDSAIFFINGVIDNIVDGRQSVLLTATAPGFGPAQNTLNVTDVATLNLAFAATQIFENDGTLGATITRNTPDVSSSLTVDLASTKLNVLQVPAAVVIPAGQSSVGFQLQVIDDDLLDGLQAVVVTATSQGLVDAVEQLSVEDFETLTVTISPDTLAENAGTATAVVARSNTDNGADLTVSLTSSDLGVATVPATVQIPANQASVSFDVTILDDTILDGPQTVNIVGAASGYISIPQTLSIPDFEALLFTLADTNISENGGSTLATVSRTNTDIGQPLVVAIQSAAPDEATGPQVLTIGANQTSATFTIVGVDDDLFDGDQPVVLTASAAGHVDGATSVIVTDHETLTLTIAADTIFERGGETTATITRNNTNLQNPLLVNLQSNRTDKAIVPATVEIPIGDPSANFTISAVENAVLDGVQIATITATAVGYVGDNDIVNVTDEPAITVRINATQMSESNGQLTGTVTRHNANENVALQIGLQSSDEHEATVPNGVQMLPGDTSTTFTIAAEDDDLLDGDKPVTITASAAPFNPASAQFTVTDHELLSVTVDNVMISESGGTATGTVTRPNTDNGQALAVTLITDDPSALSFTKAITIPANEASATFSIFAVDDTILDGVQDALIQAEADGFISSLVNLQVLDFESLEVEIASNAISENGGVATATVRRSNSDISQPLVVVLTNDHPGEATVPPMVTIPALATTATFAVTALDDDMLDGSHDILITAAAGGYISQPDGLRIADHEPLFVAILADSISENLGATTATVTRANTDIGSDLLVTLASDDPTEAEVPPTVTILANEASATFPVLAVDDSVFDGTRVASITATAAGYEAGSDTLDVQDHEALTLTIDEASITEAGERAFATVTRQNTNLMTPIAITITNSHPTKAVVSPVVVIPAGLSSSLPFPITSIDNNTFDGDVLIAIDVSAPGYAGDTATLQIEDHEALTLTLFNSSISENGGSTLATVRRENDDHTLTVTLQSSDPNSANLIGNVTLPTGRRVSDPFEIFGIDDNQLDGVETVTISATAPGYVGSNAILSVLDHETLTLTLDTNTVSESQTALIAGTVSRGNLNNSQPLAVLLVSSDPSEATVTSIVQIPANASSATFQVQPIDDDELDGTQFATISAAAAGFANSATTLTVADHETLSLAIDSAQISEEDGIATATISRSNLGNTALEVALQVDDPNQASVPDTVTIPPQLNSVSFEITAVDDTLLDGLHTVAVTATAAGYQAATNSIDVADHETLTLTLDAATISEGNGNGSGEGENGASETMATVTRSNTDISQPLIVTLSASDPTQVTLPSAPIIIPANSSSVRVLVQAADDVLLDGTVTVTLTATAAGYVSGTANVDVADNESLTASPNSQAISENGGSTTVVISPPFVSATSTLQVTGVTNSNPSEAVSTGATPQADGSVLLSIGAIDDLLLDGTQIVEMTVSATYTDGGQAHDLTAMFEILVEDHETLTVAVNRSPLNEGQTATATVTRSNVDNGNALVVSLTNSHPSRLTVPSTVEIPAGAPSAAFVVTAITNQVADGTTNVQITPVAAGYVSVPGGAQITEFPWHNAANPEDVNGDTFVAADDVLQVINELNANGSRTLPAPTAGFQPPPFLDVDGDGAISATDALLVINRINEGSPEGEGESAPTTQGFGHIVVVVRPVEDDDPATSKRDTLMHIEPLGAVQSIAFQPSAANVSEVFDNPDDDQEDEDEQLDIESILETIAPDVALA
jgi:hypothetical protein